MRRNRDQRGEGQLGCIFGILLLLLGIFIAYKMIPVKVKAAELRSVVVNEAKAAGSHGDDQILKAILREAEQQNLPVTADNVKIERKRGEIMVDVQYHVPIDFPGFTYNWPFHHRAENPIF
jgi:hypothetical protein